jgi:hypothetical protein
MVSVRDDHGRMRRLARIPLNCVKALSLILFIATAVLWVRSYFVADEWG